MFWSLKRDMRSVARGFHRLQKNISIRRSAQKLAKAGQLAKAIDTYLPILEADADPYDHLYVGDMCVKAGRAQEAVQHYEAAIEQYRKLGFHRNAVALCRKILRLDPGHYDIHRRLGQLFAADELIGDALESYQTYLSRVPENNRANKVFGQAIEHACELALKRTELALRLSDALLEVDRSDEAAEVLVRSAEVSHRDGDGELAAELLCKAAEIDPDVTERVGGMTTAVEDPTGGETPADSAEAAALDPGGEVVAEIRSSLEELVLEPPASRAPDGRAVPEVGTGEVPETGTDGLLEDLISTGVGKKQESRSPEIDFGTIELGGQEEGDLLPAPEGEPPGLLDGLMHTSDVAGSQPDERAPAGNLADPVSATREAVEAEQWTAAARRVEEWLQLDSQSGAAAEKLVEISEALQDNAGVVRGLILQGDLLIQDEDLQAALPFFERVLKIEPGNDTAQRRMARFAELGLEGAGVVPPTGVAGDEVPLPGVVKDVLAASEAVVDVRDPEAPNEDEPEEHQEWLEIGALLEEFQEGIRQQVGDEDPQANYDLGVSHMEMELFEEALDQFEIALRGDDLAPSFIRRLYELRGNCQRSLERHREAIHEYRLGLEIEGGTPSERNGLRYLLSRQYEAVGELNAAKEILRVLLDEQPSFREAAEFLSKLESDAA